VTTVHAYLTGIARERQANLHHSCSSTTYRARRAAGCCLPADRPARLPDRGGAMPLYTDIHSFDDGVARCRYRWTGMWESAGPGVYQVGLPLLCAGSSRGPLQVGIQQKTRKTGKAVAGDQVCAQASQGRGRPITGGLRGCGR
jgi:hypothetical protein